VKLFLRHIDRLPSVLFHPRREASERGPRYSPAGGEIFFSFSSAFFRHIPAEKETGVVQKELVERRGLARLYSATNSERGFKGRSLRQQTRRGQY
jgi:hypothetical protein